MARGIRDPPPSDSLFAFQLMQFETTDITLCARQWVNSTMATVKNPGRWSRSNAMAFQGEERRERKMLAWLGKRVHVIAAEQRNLLRRGTNMRRPEFSSQVLNRSFCGLGSERAYLPGRAPRYCGQDYCGAASCQGSVRYSCL